MFRQQQNLFEDVIGRSLIPMLLGGKIGLSLIELFLCCCSESDGRELDLGELGVYDGCMGED